MTNAPAKFDVAFSRTTLFDLLPVAQYPQHHVTYTPTLFEGAMLKG